MQIWRSTKRLLSKRSFSTALVVLSATVVIFLGGFFIPREILIAPFHNLFVETDYKMSQKIRDGIAMLKSSPPLEYVAGSKQQVALALLNKKTGELTEERIWITPQGQLLSSSLPVKIKWWNSFNSYYEIDGHPELVVVANKFLVERKYLPEQTTLLLDLDAPQSKYTDMVYAPYSENLHTPDVVDAGKEYINTHADTAYKELRALNVQSKSHPGKLVADVVPKNLVKNIVLVEHVDPGWLQFADDGGHALVERALVIIGGNREWAYRYTNSPAHASGLAQFIQPTYDLMVERYPEAHLIKNHMLGMADHTNAFKAIILLFDNETREIESKIGVSATAEMLAAAYNVGPNRVIQAIKNNGQDWAHSDIFPTETTNYVKKYELIAHLKIF